ncbi:hypothetical protein MASR2M48_18150 [Spirochaetota bacterium]
MQELAGNPDLAIVVAGDFNENPDEFERVDGAYPTALMSPDAGVGPWLLISNDMEDLPAWIRTPHTLLPMDRLRRL